MPKALALLTNIEKSVDSNLLWPSIADALGAFIRRRSSGAEGYELTWRLIHVWEAITAVLSTAITAYFRTAPGYAHSYLRAREHWHGRSWDPLTRTFNRSTAALDGSATRRHDILWDLENIEPGPSRFLTAAKSFLAASDIRLRSLVSSWGQICDVPPDIAAGDTFTVREAFRHVNTLRNRFAHIPFPYDEMGKLSEALGDVTEQLFSVDPKPWQHFPDDRIESPLSGALDCRSRRLRGSIPPQISPGSDVDPQFVFPAVDKKPLDLTERWDASPFVFVDSMFRPSILTRLISEANGVWEYTRFLAERNSVVRLEKPEYLASLPQPSQGEYPAPAEEQVEPPTLDISTTQGPTEPGSTTVSELEGALRHIANEEYEPAIKFLKNLTAAQPTYHIGWLRLGHAQRELAMRRRLADSQEARQLFNDSIASLTRAAEHTHIPRQAQALYERSKAYFHRNRLRTDDGNDDHAAALEDARLALELSRESRYETWIHFLQQHQQRSSATLSTVP